MMSHSDNLHLKNQAKERAMLHVWEQMYRAKMRYEPREYAHTFGLTESEVSELEDHFVDVDFPARLVVVNLPPDADLDEAKKAAVRCSSKCYVSEVVVTFELAESGDHPHYNFLFLSNVSWLAESRIRREFAQSFGIDYHHPKIKNIVHVTNLTFDDFNYKVEEYVSKENIWKMDKRSQKCKKPHVGIPKKSKKTILNFVEY